MPSGLHYTACEEFLPACSIPCIDTAKPNVGVDVPPMVPTTRISSWLDMSLGAAVSNDLQNRVHGLQQLSAEQAPAYAELYFGSLVTRAWLNENKDWLYQDAPDFIEKLLEGIDKMPVQTEFEYLQRLRLY